MKKKKGDMAAAAVLHKEASLAHQENLQYNGL
jgi:hypothetical protein